MRKKWLLTFSMLFTVSLTFAFIGCNTVKKEQVEKREVANFATEINVSDYFGDGDSLINAKLYDTKGEKVQIKNGIVFFDELGEYKLVLQSGTTYVFEVVDKEGPVAVLKDQESVVYKGEQVRLDVEFIDRAGASVVDYDLAVTFGENEVSVTEGYFVAEELGVYTVTVDATDSVGNENTTVISIESMESVYGKGIYVIPEQENAGVVTYREKYAEGEHAGKYRTVVRKDYNDTGFGYLTVKATEEAGLKPNTYYGLALRIDSDNDNWCYYNPDNEWLTKKSSPNVNFTVKTDERGEYYTRWRVFYSRASYFDFSLAEFHEYAYGQGIDLTVAPKPLTTKLVAFDELNEDGLYIKGLKRSASDFATLTLQAKKEANLLPNTQYDVIITAECDGAYPAYYEPYEKWFIDKDRTEIKYTVTTDDNGEFTLKSNSYFRTGTYVKFTGVTIEQTPESAYGEGIEITPLHGVATIGTELLKDGNNAGKQIVVMNKPNGKDGAGKLTVSASTAVGLKANTVYVVTMEIEVDRTDGNASGNGYYDQGNAWLAKPNAPTCKFEITTDANGEFTKTFNTWWVGKSTFVKFKAITIAEK